MTTGNTYLVLSFFFGFFVGITHLVLTVLPLPRTNFANHEQCKQSRVTTLKKRSKPRAMQTEPRNYLKNSQNHEQCKQSWATSKRVKTTSNANKAESPSTLALIKYSNEKKMGKTKWKPRAMQTDATVQRTRWDNQKIKIQHTNYLSLPPSLLPANMRTHTPNSTHIHTYILTYRQTQILSRTQKTRPSPL